MLVEMPGNTGMCAKWQMGHVSSEPGASRCHSEAIVATNNMAATAAVSTAIRRQLRCSSLHMRRIIHLKFQITNKRFRKRAAGTGIEKVVKFGGYRLQ
jgi:hypothetical protein